MEKAGFLTRLLALIIDSILIGIIAGILSGCVGAFGAMSGSDNDFIALLASLLSFVVWVVVLLLQFLYFGYFWSKDGQSLGMKLLRIKVVMQDGRPMSFLIAGLRGTIGYWISSLILGLGFLWAAFDAKKEAWHDKIFRTSVVVS
jgi:uncharacterized RDD family membrane protein YckC